MEYKTPEMEVIELNCVSTYLVSGGEGDDNNKPVINWPTQPSGDGW